MKNRFATILCLTTLLGLAVALGRFSPRFADATQTQTARGVVFHDQNGNGLFDSGEPTLNGIRVSNGREIVRTDSDGQYRLPVTDDSIVFVVKPRGWRTPLSNDQLPQFYYIHKPAGSKASKHPGVAPTGALPASVDFPLYPQNEPDEFRAIMFGDPQPRNQKEIDYIAHDVVEELIGTDASFGVTLGDIMFDDLSLFGSLNRTIALLGIPWYNVIGNHDINREARNDRDSDETFERVFGPSYYSFDYGPVHFLVLDDVEWYVDEGDEKGHYRGGLGTAQMEFIRNDLAIIPDDQLVVLMMHIPLLEVRDRRELYRLIEQRPFCMSISGHEHIHEHRYITRDDGWMGPEPHHHVINVTVSGSWWGGSPDERGIPHTLMRDGAPNGYSIISFDGHEYEVEFRAAGRSTDYQMEIYAPEEVSTDQLTKTEVWANVFNGSGRDTVEIRVGRGDEWQPMEHRVENDPQFMKVAAAEEAIGDKRTWTRLPAPRASTHLWRTTLPDGLKPGTHAIEVRFRGHRGDNFIDRRVIRVLPAQKLGENDDVSAREDDEIPTLFTVAKKKRVRC